jgi:hypothetical protein
MYLLDIVVHNLWSMCHFSIGIWLKKMLFENSRQSSQIKNSGPTITIDGLLAAVPLTKISGLK